MLSGEGHLSVDADAGDRRQGGAVAVADASTSPRASIRPADRCDELLDPWLHLLPDLTLEGVRERTKGFGEGDERLLLARLLARLPFRCLLC